METFRAAPCSSFWAVHLVTIPCLFLVICQCQLGFPPRHSYSTSGELLLIPHSHVHQSSKGINFAITPETPWAPAAVRELKAAMRAQPWITSGQSWVNKKEAPSGDSSFKGQVCIKKDPVQQHGVSPAMRQMNLASASLGFIIDKDM